MKHFNAAVKLSLMPFAFSVLLNLSAFAEITDGTSLHYYEKGKKAYVFDENTKFLESLDSEKSPLIKILPIDTVVTIQEDLSRYDEGRTHIENGLELPFIKVKLTDGTEGYVWAASLAKTTLTVDLDLDDTQERILTNFTAITQQAEGQRLVTTTVKVLREGKVINSEAFDVPYFEANGLATTLYKPAGFTPSIQILKEEFQPEACGVLGGAVIFAWHKSHWVKALDEEFISDAGAFSNDVEFIFPAERNGKANTIKALRTVLSDFDDRTNKYKKAEHQLTTYEWKNGDFKASKSVALRGKKWP